MKSLTQEQMDEVSAIAKRYAPDTVVRIREYLGNTLNSSHPVPRRILFGQDDESNQHYLGDFEVWGDGVVLFVPGPDYRDYLCFVSSSGVRLGEDPNRTPIYARGHSIITSGSHLDFAFLELKLDPMEIFSTVKMSDSGGETILWIPSQHTGNLHTFLDSIFSPRSHG